jgi:Flp pilus assembly pilin Flp
MVEYSMMVLLIALLALGLVQLLGLSVLDMFQSLADLF